MADLLADENFPRPVVEALRALGHDVRTVQDAGLRGRTDIEVLTAATASGRAVLSHDRDYLRLHARIGRTAGSSFARPTRTRPPWRCGSTAPSPPARQSTG